tara:strand:- start:85 stop:366 length:282 start_codon:yes stop_codon:yes gene_type:complete
MGKIYDLVVKVGEYQKDGQTKAKNKNIGIVMQNDKGMYIIMDRTFNPAGVPNPDNKESLFISMYEAKSDTATAKHTVDKGNAAQEDLDDEIPF